MLLGIIINIYVENYQNLFVSIFGFIVFLKLIILINLKVKNISEHILVKLFLASLLIYPTLYFGYNTLQKKYFYSQAKQEFCGFIEHHHFIHNKTTRLIWTVKSQNQQSIEFEIDLEPTPDYKIGDNICIIYIHDIRWQQHPHIFHINKN